MTSKKKLAAKNTINQATEKASKSEAKKAGVSTNEVGMQSQTPFEISLKCEIEILNSVKIEKDIQDFLNKIKGCLHNKNYSIQPSIAKEKNNKIRRITANSLNDEIRDKIKVMWNDVLFEAIYDNEVNKFIGAKSAKQGFDFVLSTPNGKINYIIGEIQFGNWALLYYDFLKIMLTNLIMKENKTKVSLFIYILATGKLTKRLSDGIVTITRTKKTFNSFFNAFERFLKFPIVVLKLKE